MITYNDLKEKSKAIESKYNINHYEVLQKFMFERILEVIRNFLNEIEIVTISV